MARSSALAGVGLERMLEKHASFRRSLRSSPGTTPLPPFRSTKNTSVFLSGRLFRLVSAQSNGVPKGFSSSKGGGFGNGLIGRQLSGLRQVQPCLGGPSKWPADEVWRQVPMAPVLKTAHFLIKGMCLEACPAPHPESHLKPLIEKRHKTREGGFFRQMSLFGDIDGDV